MQLEDGTSIRGQPVDQKFWISFLHEAMELMVESLKGSGYRSFEVERKRHGKWKCFPVIISYYSDIPEESTCLL